MNFYSEKNSLLPPKFIFRECSTLVPQFFWAKWPRKKGSWVPSDLNFFRKKTSGFGKV